MKPFTRFADFHCDTLTKSDRIHFLDSGNLQNPLSAHQNFVESLIYYACFTSPSVSSDRGYQNFLQLSERLHLFPFPPGVTPVLTVEDGRIFRNSGNRLLTAILHGMRLLTPLWQDENSIGGAFNTDKGLTAGGKQLLSLALRFGVVLDISHASVASASEICALSAENGMPAVATHSCAYAVTPHERNLRPDAYSAIIQSGGLVGIALYPPFLSDTGSAGIEDILRHVDWFLSHGDISHLAIGSDFDGVDRLPVGISGPGDLILLWERLQQYGLKEEEIDRLFYRNLFDFTKKYIAPVSRLSDSVTG